MFPVYFIFELLSLILNVLSRFFKKQHHNLLVNIFASFLNVIAYLLNKTYMGMVGLIVSTLRSITFYFFAKNKWDKKLWLLIVFTVAQFGTCTFTAILNGLVILDFVLVFFKGTIYTYGSWQHNVKVFWWSSIVSSTVATIYNLMHGHYLMVASEVLSIVILVYMIIKNAIASKKGKDKTDDKSDSSEVAEETNTAEANVEAQVEAPAGE